MKLALSTICAAIAATAAAAGSMAPPMVDTVVVDHGTTMSNGSGAWLIPLAIIAILALTLTNDRPL